MTTSTPLTAPTVSTALQSGVRFRASPDEALVKALPQWIGCQRAVYNGKVDEDRLFASQRRLLIAAGETDVKTPLDRQYAQFKDDELTPWLSQVPSQILRNGCDRWMEGKQRQLKGLSEAPAKRNRSNFNSVLITNELFRLVERTDAHGVIHAALELGTRANPVGVLNFTAHREFGVPKQIVVLRTGKHWWLSFSYAHDAPEGFVPRDAAELAYELNLLEDDDLAATTLGIDRNVKDNCVATSDGRFFGLSVTQRQRLERKAVGAKRIQRRLSRQVKGSKNSAKTRSKLATKHEYRGNVARDFSHQTSHSLTTEPCNDTSSAPRLIAFEALKIKNMTAKAKPKQDASGRWLRNGAAQKSGLNRSILMSCWGTIAEQTKYKSFRLNTLVLSVAAAYSSQECSRDGHIHPGNRNEQRFVCQRCGFEAHADTNAACVVAGRGTAMVRDQKVVVKAKKSVAFRRRTQTGQELPGVPVEETVRRAQASAELTQLVPLG